VTDHAREQTHVAADPARCFAIATDFAAYPRWAGDVKEVEVRERDADGRGTRVAFRVAAIGRSIRYVLDYDYADAPRSFSWTLHEGDQLRTLDGRYTFEADEDGTLVDYDLAVDVAMPLPSLVTRRAAAIIVRTALGDFRRAVETTVVTAAAAAGAETPSPGPHEPADAPVGDPQPDPQADVLPDPQADVLPDPQADVLPDPPRVHPDAVPFDAVARDAPTSSVGPSTTEAWPGSAWLDALAHEVLGAVPEVRDHVLDAADAALAALRALLDAAERALDRQRGADESH
jgi:hypothetical protein